jgi:hypothetical protein
MFIDCTYLLVYTSKMYVVIGIHLLVLVYIYGIYVVINIIGIYMSVFL